MQHQNGDWNECFSAIMGGRATLLMRDWLAQFLRELSLDFDHRLEELFSPALVFL